MSAAGVARRLAPVIPSRWRRRLREQFVRARMAHVFGASRVQLRPDEAAVACVVKNGAFYLESFLEHYRRLGVRHVFLLDNGSTDDTLSLAGRHRDVTVYRCVLPIESYQQHFKRSLIALAVPRGWCVDVDIDEYFDYPHSDVVPLPSLLAYLNGRHYTAVLAHQLDLFSDRPLAELTQADRRERLAELYRYYDVSQVTAVDYRTAPLARRHARHNRAPVAARLYFGGVRKALVGLDCLLTKHSLVRVDAGLDLFPHVHFVDRAFIADVSAVLLHYKFASNAYERATLNRDAFVATRAGYDRLLRLMDGAPEHHLRESTAREFRAAADLVDEGFLFASDAYRAHVAAIGSASSARDAPPPSRTGP